MGESHWVYVLSCENGLIYVGETERIFKRLTEHCTNKGAKVTQKNKPVTLIALYKVEDNFDIDEFYNLDIKKMCTSLEYNIFRLFERHYGNKTYGASHCKLIDNVQYNRNLYNYYSNRPTCNCNVPCEYDKINNMWICSIKCHGWISSQKFEKNRTDLPEEFLKNFQGGCDYTRALTPPPSRDLDIQVEEKEHWFQSYLCCK